MKLDYEKQMEELVKGLDELKTTPKEEKPEKSIEELQEETVGFLRKGIETAQRLFKGKADKPEDAEETEETDKEEEPEEEEGDVYKSINPEEFQDAGPLLIEVNDRLDTIFKAQEAQNNFNEKMTEGFALLFKGLGEVTKAIKEKSDDIGDHKEVIQGWIEKAVGDVLPDGQTPNIAQPKSVMEDQRVPILAESGDLMKSINEWAKDEELSKAMEKDPKSFPKGPSIWFATAKQMVRSGATLEDQFFESFKKLLPTG